MTHSFGAALLLGVLAAAQATAGEHEVRIEHRGGAVDARYRSNVTVAHRQVGAVAPGGVPSSLRCQWSASLAVDREARHASGATMRRMIAREAVIQGHRPGWCDTHRASIAREVAERAPELRPHLVSVAQEDQSVLLEEIERLHHQQREG